MVLVTSATFPFVALMRIPPLASGVGSGAPVVPPESAIR